MTVSEGLSIHGTGLSARRVTPWKTIVGLVVLTSMAGCGGSGSSSSTAARVPGSSGDVWELEPTAGRNAMPGAVLAFVNGLGGIVIDGDTAYAGMTRMKVERQSNGVRAIHLANNLTAELVPGAGGRLDLHFSSGETVPMHRK